MAVDDVSSARSWSRRSRCSRRGWRGRATRRRQRRSRPGSGARPRSPATWWRSSGVVWHVRLAQIAVDDDPHWDWTEPGPRPSLTARRWSTSWPCSPRSVARPSRPSASVRRRRLGAPRDPRHVRRPRCRRAAAAGRRARRGTPRGTGPGRLTRCASAHRFRARALWCLVRFGVVMVRSCAETG